MRALVQRVTRASVDVGGEAVGSIGPGLLVYLGVRRGDGDEEAAWLARKVAGLRVFGGADGRFDRSLLDEGGAALVVSQFTLYGDARRGRRPDFTAAAEPGEAERLYEAFVGALRVEGVGEVATGRFRAMMAVSSVNDGPVTVMLEREAGSGEAGA